MALLTALDLAIIGSNSMAPSPLVPCCVVQLYHHEIPGAALVGANAEDGAVSVARPRLHRPSGDVTPLAPEAAPAEMLPLPPCGEPAAGIPLDVDPVDDPEEPIGGGSPNPADATEVPLELILPDEPAGLDAPDVPGPAGPTDAPVVVEGADGSFASPALWPLCAPGSPTIDPGTLPISPAEHPQRRPLATASRPRNDRGAILAVLCPQRWMSRQQKATNGIRKRIVTGAKSSDSDAYTPWTDRVRIGLSLRDIHVKNLRSYMPPKGRIAATTMPRARERAAAHFQSWHIRYSILETGALLRDA
jgi:hypothetical protein